MQRDRRRKHRHWQVTVYYQDGEKFARVYIDRDRAGIFDVKAAGTRGSFRVARLDRLNDIAEFGETGGQAPRLRQGCCAQH